MAFFSEASSSAGDHAGAFGSQSIEESCADSALTVPKSAFCPLVWSLCKRLARASALSIDWYRLARHCVTGWEFGFNESSAPAQTKLSKTLLLSAPGSHLPTKSKNDRNFPSERAATIALTLACPTPLIAPRPYLIALLRGVKSPILSLISGERSLPPCPRNSFEYFKTFAVSCISFESTAA